MKINLFVAYYKDKNEARQKELDFCLGHNIRNKLINHVYLFSETGSLPEITKRKKVTVVKCPRRTYFADYINCIEKFKLNNCWNIVSNSDIFFGETLSLLNQHQFPENIFMALSRHDVTFDADMAEFTAKLHRHSDSQDVWIMKGNPLKNTAEPKAMLKFLWVLLGKAGCDNRFAWVFHHFLFRLINPCVDIKIYHYHTSDIKHYVPEERFTDCLMHVHPTHINKTDFPLHEPKI